MLRARIADAPHIAQFLDSDAIARGDAAATQELLYTSSDGWELMLFARDSSDATAPPGRICSLKLPGTKARVAARILRLLFRGDVVECRRALPILPAQQLAALCDPAATRLSWPAPQEPGIYRREHASVLI